MSKLLNERMILRVAMLVPGMLVLCYLAVSNPEGSAAAALIALVSMAATYEFRGRIERPKE